MKYSNIQILRTYFSSLDLKEFYFKPFILKNDGNIYANDEKKPYLKKILDKIKEVYLGSLKLIDGFDDKDSESDYILYVNSLVIEQLLLLNLFDVPDDFNVRSFFEW